MCVSERASFVSKREARGQALVPEQSNVNFIYGRSFYRVVLLNCDDLRRGRSVAFVIFVVFELVVRRLLAQERKRERLPDAGVFRLLYIV